MPDTQLGDAEQTHLGTNNQGTPTSGPSLSMQKVHLSYANN